MEETLALSNSTFHTLSPKHTHTHSGNAWGFLEKETKFHK